MVKRQYHKDMEKKIQEIPAGSVPRLLLHSCCGPCSTAVLEQLMPYFEIVLFYYNPNIAPEDEFYRRLETQKQLLAQLQPPHPITLLAPPYDDQPFWDAVKGVEDTPEMGARCEKCIAQRMREAAIAADRENCDYFTTTLTVSPHKNAKFINTYGEEIEKDYRAAYLPSDFKKGGGYARSVALSGEYGLYRQDYCGCPMSLREAEERRTKREAKCKQSSESEESDPKTKQFLQMLLDHEHWLEQQSERYKRSLYAIAVDAPPINHVTVKNLTLTGHNLQSIELDECTFINCKFKDVDFFGGWMGGCRFISCSFTHCIMGKSNMSYTFMQDTVFKDCTLIKTELDNTELVHVTFHCCDLTRAWFWRASMKAVTLTACDLDGAAFHEACVKEITLTECKLTDCDLPEMIAADDGNTEN